MGKVRLCVLFLVSTVAAQSLGPSLLARRELMFFGVGMRCRRVPGHWERVRTVPKVRVLEQVGGKFYTFQATLNFEWHI